MKLYIYDHCPYCVKARMIFGFKGMEVSLVTLLNDDEKTPIGLIGRKMVPILEREDGAAMPESMDIVHYVDNHDGPPVLYPVPANSAVPEWLNAVGGLVYQLAMPRWVRAPLEEFATSSARDYFTRKKEAYIGPFDALLAQSAGLIAEAEHQLRELEPLIQSADAVHGRLTDDDIHLFATLRSLSIVKGLHYPSVVEAYRQRLAARSHVPLHDDLAI